MSVHNAFICEFHVCGLTSFCPLPQFVAFSHLRTPMSSCVTDDLAKGRASGISHDTDGMLLCVPVDLVQVYC